MINTYDKGKEVEDLVQKICSKMFSSDFVIRNPEYKKLGGKQKEAADFLIPFKNSLLVFQVKSKVELKKVSEKNEIDIARIVGKIEEAIKQFKAIKEAMKHNLLHEVENCLGIKFPFNPKNFDNIIGFVILDLLGEEQFTEEERTNINDGFHLESNLPIHIMTREDLELIASELDTIPDFLKYIDIREKLYSEKILSPFTSEKEFLALFKCQPDILEKIVAEKTNHIVIDPNIWIDYQKHEQKQIEESIESKKSSYLIDEIISTLHKCVGYSNELGSIILRNDLPQGTLENYLASVTELSSLTRMERKILADRLLHVMRQADNSTGNISTIYLDGSKEAFLVLY